MEDKIYGTLKVLGLSKMSRPFKWQLLNGSQSNATKHKCQHLEALFFLLFFFTVGPTFNESAFPALNLRYQGFQNGYQIGMK